MDDKDLELRLWKLWGSHQAPLIIIRETFKGYKNHYSCIFPESDSNSLAYVRTVYEIDKHYKKFDNSLWS